MTRIDLERWFVILECLLQCSEIRLKFVPIIYDDSIVSDLIGWLIRVANYNLLESLINVHCRNELQNKLRNFATNIPNLQINIRSHI